MRFLSCEPLLGPVDLSEWIERVDHCVSCGEENAPQGPDLCPSCKSEGSLVSTWGEAQRERYPGFSDDDGPELHWVIAGGESGPGAQPMHPAWARSLRDQCVEAGVAFLFKQWGEWCPAGGVGPTGAVVTLGGRVENMDGAKRVGKALGWPSDDPRLEDVACMSRVGKKAAGRLLDGREWNEVPHGAL